MFTGSRSLPEQLRNTWEVAKTTTTTCLVSSMSQTRIRTQFTVIAFLTIFSELPPTSQFHLPYPKQKSKQTLPIMAPSIPLPYSWAKSEIKLHNLDSRIVFAPMVLFVLILFVRRYVLFGSIFVSRSMYEQGRRGWAWDRNNRDGILGNTGSGSEKTG